MKRKASASNLERWQVEDAARLKKLLDQERKSPGWPGQDAFAEASIGRSGSYLTQLATGYRPLQLEHAAALARKLRVKVEDISPTLAQKLSSLHEPAAPLRKATVTNLPLRVAEKPTHYTLHGMQVTPEEVEFGIEWGKLDEPARTLIRQQVMLLVAEQVRARRRKTPRDDHDPKPTSR